MGNGIAPRAKAVVPSPGGEGQGEGVLLATVAYGQAALAILTLSMPEL